MKAVAMYDYNAADDDELTFRKGQIIKEVIAFNGGWSKGRLHNGQYGIFPINYVEMMRAVGEFSMLSAVDMCAACCAVPSVDSTGTVEEDIRFC